MEEHDLPIPTKFEHKFHKFHNSYSFFSIVQIPELLNGQEIYVMFS